ncbi:hypothetical protein [Vitiosangium sp. GDMCC 1.1324]|uniref:hypothetical protein n=1 Tax=Vitiosangium sp. (strain GDMCC 1.1324) TaxID=2138576 RepID=UPI0011B5D8D8|nr:hypothetical protein [Vitiosangium sp. GDMCC 1.1324]
MTSRRRELTRVALSVLALLGGSASQAASSRDYPGPCQGETTVPGTPVYLASDYHRTNPDTRVISMPDVGRLRPGRLDLPSQSVQPGDNHEVEKVDARFELPGGPHRAARALEPRGPPRAPSLRPG